MHTGWIMVGMTTTQPPSGLELKSPAMLAPRPEVTPAASAATTVDPVRATVRMVAAVTGTVDEVGDRIVPARSAAR